MRTAILQVADTGPLESFVVMLNSVGYRCCLPSESLKHELRRLGCDTVLDVDSLVRGMGYDRPFDLPEAGTADMARTDVLYVDIKAHRNGPRVWKRWPHLEKRTLWYRINGGRPEHVVNTSGDHGDEVNPPCPVLTPNQWYADGACPVCENTARTCDPNCEFCGGEWENPLAKNAYCCWPPFYRFDDYKAARFELFSDPVCLIHNVAGWGYQELIQPMRKLGVVCYGAGSPDGLIHHSSVKGMLASALCMVHLKSNDAPGYALYEALAAGCPVVCTQRMIWRCRMHELLDPGVTCLTFDHNETHDALTAEQIVECTAEVNRALELLADPSFNRKIGEAGRDRLKSIMWSTERGGDMESLRSFMTRNFGA